jgi:hypothetical protein
LQEEPLEKPGVFYLPVELHRPCIIFQIHIKGLPFDEIDHGPIKILDELVLQRVLQQMAVGLC